MEDINESVGRRIEYLRKRAKLSKAALGRKLGVSHVAIGGWESGSTSNLRHENLLKLADFFNTTVHYILTGEGENIALRVQDSDDLPSYAIEKFPGEKKITHEELELISSYRKLNPINQNKLLAICKILE